MRRQLILAALLLVVVLAVWSRAPAEDAPYGQGAAAEVPADIAALAQDYSDLESMRAQPYIANEIVYTLCRDPAEFPRGGTPEVHGPHAQLAVMVFMNALAAEAFRAGEATYPVGAVILKEKQSLEQEEIAGVGGMLKRETGFDPEHGDWEFFYYESLENISAGKLANCIECHQQAAATDHVFGHWRFPQPISEGEPLQDD